MNNGNKSSTKKGKRAILTDFDDERTLEEEEALAAGETDTTAQELLYLEKVKEKDMPLPQLLAIYGYRMASENGESLLDEEEAETVEDEEEEEEVLVKETVEQSKERESALDCRPELRLPVDGVFRNRGDPSRLLRSVSRVGEEEEEEVDLDYLPEDEEEEEEQWQKMDVFQTIMVGSDYQAMIPDGLCHYDDALPYENEDKLLWDPSCLEKDIAEDFLKKATALSKPAIPMGAQLRDDEQALFLLQQCGYNVDEALRRIRINVVPLANSMGLWSEEECKNFESGVRSFGKDFHSIQQNKVRTRSVGELVQFYYLWKKSERHDIFANKTRLEKKKYTLHPGLTDFMDRFLEDQDGRDRSSSPIVQQNSADNKKVVADNVPTQNTKSTQEI